MNKSKLISDLSSAGLLLDRISAKHRISKDNIPRTIDLINNGVPMSIFSRELATLESIVKYLKEDGFDYNEIAAILDRKAGPIGITYRRSLKKQRSRLDGSSGELLPLRIFGSTKRSVLESACAHLHSTGRSYEEIALLMKRDYKTVWTVINRAKAK